MAVTVPTPTVFVSARLLEAIRLSVRAAPDRERLPWRPLPPVDLNALARRRNARQAQEAARQRREAAAAQEPTARVGSAFSRPGDGGLFSSAFGAGRGAHAPKPAPGGILGAAQVSGGRRREAEKEEEKEKAAPRGDDDFLKRLRTDWRR